MARDTYFKNTLGQEPWELRGTASSAAAAAVSGALPVGVITAYYGTVAPTGWLLCDGAAIPAAYTTLIALVGANTPNLKGKVVVGIDAAQTEFDTLGETGGSKTSTAAHTHSHNHGSHAHSHGHTWSHGSQVGTHQHGVTTSLGGGTIGLTPGANNYALLETLHTTSTEDAAHSHTGTNATDAQLTTPTTDASASNVGATSGNLAPYIAISYIIKAA